MPSAGSLFSLVFCEHKTHCLYRYDAEKDAEKNKVIKINEQWEEVKERSHANIQSERGILKRQTRSIQAEGHLQISRKMRASGVLTTVRQIRYVKNSCCMTLAK